MAWEYVLKSFGSCISRFIRASCDSSAYGTRVNIFDTNVEKYQHLGVLPLSNNFRDNPMVLLQFHDRFREAKEAARVFAQVEIRERIVQFKRQDVLFQGNHVHCKLRDMRIPKYPFFFEDPFANEGLSWNHVNAVVHVGI